MAITDKQYNAKDRFPCSDKTKNDEVELFTKERKRAIDICQDLFGIYYSVNVYEVVDKLTVYSVMTMIEYKEVD